MFVFTVYLTTILCSCGLVEEKFNRKAEDAAQKFNSMAGAIKTKQDISACFEDYKHKEMLFIQIKVKSGYDDPLARFYTGTSNSLAKIQKDYDMHPEYDKGEKLIKSMVE